MSRGVVFGEIQTPDTGGNVTSSEDYADGDVLTATAETKTYYILLANRGPSAAGENPASWSRPPGVVELHWIDPAAAACTVSAMVGSSVADIVAHSVAAVDIFGTAMTDIDPNTALSPAYIDVSARAGGPFDVIAIKIVADTGLTVKCVLLQ